MKKVVLFTLLAAFAISMFALVGCDSENTNDNDTNNDLPVLKMATEATFPPYEYVENNEIVGIDAEIAGLIANELGMKLEIVNIAFDSIVAGVETGKYDIGMACMTVTEDRLESVNFSTSYAKGVQVVIVKEESPITSVDDLFADDATYTAGTQLSTTGDIYACDDLGEDRVTSYKTGADAVAALVAGKVDCVIIDNEPAKAFVAANEGLKILDTEYADEDYAICVNKENTELLDKINAALAKYTADGTIQEIIDRYIPAE